jgi:acyl-CoA thioesterase I
MIGRSLVDAVLATLRLVLRVVRDSAKLSRGGARVNSLPPCGGGLGWGVVQRGTMVPHLSTPTPNPSPQGGGEKRAAPSRPKLAPTGKDPAAPRSYGGRSPGVQMAARTIALAAVLLGVLPGSPARGADAPVQIVALGDSLTAGFGLPADAAFPVKLEKALSAKGLAVQIGNAGVSGDTTSGGLARLDWSVPEGTQAVILELGANDMLRGIDPKVTRQALQDILSRLHERHIEVLLCGMLAAPNLGADYGRAFDRIFPDLAAAGHLLLYPFFLATVVNNRELVQPDGLHPTAAGIDAIVADILPKVQELVARVRSRNGG